MKHTNLQQLLRETMVELKHYFVAGISEFELINMLKKAPYSLFDENALQDALMLFQTHFVLFHTLYHLRDTWRAQGFGELEIGPLQIKLHVYSNKQKAVKAVHTDIAEPDRLADYYLNWDNLADADHDSVDELLNGFWRRMAGRQVATDNNQQALADALLTLEIPALCDLSLSALKRQYRKLQHSHHPDKGGSRAASQLVLHAYTLLRKHLAYQE